jgi:hypothetical protein
MLQTFFPERSNSMSWLTLFFASFSSGVQRGRAKWPRRGASRWPSGGRPRTQRPVVETLEDRLCPSVFDLASDWSDASNPNGVWQYRHAGTAITNHWPDWDTNSEFFVSPQQAWADVPNGFGRIPSWFQSVTTSIDPTYDVPIGRVATHTTDPYSGDDEALSNVLWTSPVDGVATISGDTWQARKSLGRSNTWALFHNDVNLTGGMLTSDDPFNSSNPFLFENGSGGADVLTFPVAVGDTIKFEAARLYSIYGDFVGVDLTITVTDGPAKVLRPDANLLTFPTQRGGERGSSTPLQDTAFLAALSCVAGTKGAIGSPISAGSDELAGAPLQMQQVEKAAMNVSTLTAQTDAGSTTQHRHVDARDCLLASLGSAGELSDGLNLRPETLPTCSIPTTSS